MTGTPWVCELRRAFVLGLAALQIFCVGASPRRFALRTVLWVDDDMRPIPQRPEVYQSPLVWDLADQTLIRPLSRAPLLETPREAIDVNALDEVPDSSWFTNRLSVRRLSPEEVARGACDGVPEPPAGVWTVTSSKPDGWTPGFVALGPDGQRYLMKTDGIAQSQQPTGADVIGSRIYWAAGYFTACNRVVRLARSALRVAPGARYQDALGHEHPMGEGQLDAILERSSRYADGSYRLSASRFVEGRPLGPFRYEGTRADDPNDVVPHEERRELRGARLLAAWLNHFDAREQNTLTSWIQVGRGGYVRHYMIDFSDCLGGVWPRDALSRRMGFSHYLDVQHILEDWLGLGLFDRPWDHVRVAPEGWIFGYFGAEHFEPEQWRPGYPNPAFAHMTEEDGAWMARILARMSDAHVRAVVAEACYTHPPWNAYLERVLIARRDAILRRYLTRLSPLADFAVEGGARLCAGDRALEAGVYRTARYEALLRFEGDAERATPLAVVPGEGDRVCIVLPPPRATSVPDGDASQYRVIEVVSRPEGRAPPRPLRAHLYDLGPRRGYVLAGIER